MKDTRYILIALLLILSSLSLNILALDYLPGSLVGGVTSHSAKVGFFYIGNRNGYIQLNSDHELDKKRIITFYKSENSFLKITLDSLLPDTKYTYEIMEGDTTTLLREAITELLYKGSFKTFPIENSVSTFTFTFGSCMENFRNDSVFIEMEKHHPDLFLELGDWTYPDHAEYPKIPTSNAHRFFVADKGAIFDSYIIRYSLPHLQQLLKTTAIDYVFDDEDGIWDDFSKHSYCDLQLKDGKTIIKEISFPDSLRDNLLSSYHQYFPGYINSDQPNEAYHSFVYGNTEVFFIDTRSTRSPNSEIFYQNKKGVWKYKAPSTHQILDSVQMSWLLNGLKKSKADWKILVSGTSFNAGYKKILDICLMKMAQNRKLPNNLTGMYVAGAMSAMWFAFPATQGKLINFCRDNKIKNVFVCSGDAHTSAIDNGKHSGFPEIMAANLAQENTKFASIVANDLRLNLWNKGGQGIRNTNFNDAFGKVEVIGKDSVRLSCIDKYGTEICSYVLKDGFIPKRYNIKRHSRITFGNKLRAIKNLLKIGIHHLSNKNT